MSEFKFSIYEKKISELTKKIRRDIQVLKEDYPDKVEEFLHKLDELSNKVKLEVAFIGQYSAGKSTIIYALTKNESIKIGQDITTDEATAYEWGNIMLVDTPGIYAGRPDHDEKSLQYMDHADLLIYVITTQGFTAETAKNFQKIAFDEKRIDKMMLVINKSAQGNKEEALQNWIDDALTVIEPKTDKDVYLSIIDAQSYVEGLHTEDIDEKKVWFNYSDFETFIENLDQFVKDKGIIGRLLTPLNFLETEITNLLNMSSVDTEEVSDLLELLQRKKFRIKKSKQELEEVVTSELISLISNIEKEGDYVANLIEKDNDQETVEEANDIANERVKEYCFDTSSAIENAIESEMSNLYDELQILVESDLALSLGSIDELEISFDAKVEFKTLNTKRVKDASDILNNIGQFANSFAKNPEMVKKGIKEGLKVASKSDAHKIIYEVGKFFGHNFKPYEAVKYADKIGKIGNILGKVGIALPVLFGALEEYQEYKYDKEIKKSKTAVRNAYRSLAKDIDQEFKEQLQNFFESTYERELESINHTMSELREKFSEKNQTFITLQNDLDEINTLIRTMEK